MFSCLVSFLFLIENGRNVLKIRNVSDILVSVVVPSITGCGLDREERERQRERETHKHTQSEFLNDNVLKLIRFHRNTIY